MRKENLLVLYAFGCIRNVDTQCRVNKIEELIERIRTRSRRRRMALFSIVNGIKIYMRLYVGESECVSTLNHPKSLSSNGNVNLPNKYTQRTVE